MQKFKANPPARIKRKAEKQRLEKEEAKRLRESDEQPNQSAIDPTTGQFVPPPPQQPTPPTPTTTTANAAPPPPLNGGETPTMMNGDIKENGDTNNDNDHHNDDNEISDTLSKDKVSTSKEETNNPMSPRRTSMQV